MADEDQPTDTSSKHRGRKVRRGADGFHRVEGQPDSVYYSDEATAKRVASNLDIADAAKRSGGDQG